MQCESCSAKDIVFRNIGTKALVTEIQRLFPKAVIGRFDSDTAKKDRLEEQYKNIRDGKIDILVGTQMLGKGLDLPRLSVLGVVAADSGLGFPDFSAEERTFQLLTQVIGRVHRGHLPGKVFIQTYHPESMVISSAISKDYDSFYRQQLQERKMFGFPPFRFLLKLTCVRATSDSAKKACEKLSQEIRSSGLRIEVVGPSPAFVEKIHNRYRWQIIVKSVDRSLLVGIIRTLPAKWSYDIDPINLL
jgi:primosomal protein N' (replication factor Y)